MRGCLILRPTRDSGQAGRSAGKLNVCNSPVCFLVGFTGRRVREGFVAVPTAERLLSSVNAHVSLEVTCVGEFLPTVLERGNDVE